jgi:putative ABC transport system substrate-binding protein
VANSPKVRRIGYLSTATRAATQPSADAFVDQLRQLGWIEGENLAIEWRYADGNLQLLPQLAADLIGLPVEVLFAPGAAAVLAAHQGTTTLPIVTIAGTATISQLVQSLAQPSGNVTGTTTGSMTENIKSVELFRTVLPQLSRLAILTDRTAPAYTDVPPAEETARALGIQFQELNVRTPDDVDAAMATAKARAADGLLIPRGAYLGAVYARVIDLAAKNHLPAMYQNVEAVTDDGGLMAFGVNLLTNMRQDAEYVDKILSGAKPADLPVQEPREFDFVVNVKTAQALGITFPSDAAAQVTQWVQ